MQFKKLDLFGVNYKTRLSDSETEQKSVLGGIVTLILYSLSLAYFIYVCVQWGDNRILPRTTSMNKFEKYSEADFSDDRLFEFSYWRHSEHLVDPFQEQDNILMPLAVYLNNGIPGKIFSLLDNEELSTYNAQMISYDQVNLVSNSEFDPDMKPVTEIVVVISKCLPKYLKEGQSCASEEQITAFFNQSVAYISLWINLKQFNPSNKQLESVKKQIYLPLVDNSSLHQQIMFRQLHVAVDDGFLFESNTEYNIVNDMSILQSNVPLAFTQYLLNLDSYMVLFLRLDPIQTYLQVTFPKIGEILASVGSIVSILLTTKYIVIVFNERQLDKELMDEIILMYCPKWKSIITECKMTRKHVRVPELVRQHQEMYSKLKEKAKEKLKLTNIIYELSRLQFITQQLHGRQVLLQSHQMGLQLNDQQILRSVSLDNLDMVQKHYSSQEMGISDFTILSKPTKVDIKQSIYKNQSLLHRNPNNNPTNNKSLQIA